MNTKEDTIKIHLTDLLNDLLSYGNQEHSFKVTDIDLAKGKLSVDFDIVIIEEDNYIGFSAY